jgi:RHS repeat-associated protein
VASSTGTWKGPFGYAGGHGYQEDGSGYRLLGHRLYDPQIGRFLTRDPIQDGRNWYAYCENNPVSFLDADGLAVESAFDLIAFGVSLGQAIADPSPSNIAGAVLDGAALLIPGVPAVGGVLIKAGSTAKKVISYTDKISKLKLRGKSFTSGDKLLRKEGLVRKPNPRGPGYVYVDKKGNIRARYDPGPPAHWHKYAPGGGQDLQTLVPINDAGKAVKRTEGAAHIPTGKGKHGRK